MSLSKLRAIQARRVLSTWDEYYENRRDTELACRTGTGDNERQPINDQLAWRSPINNEELSALTKQARLLALCDSVQE